MKYILFFNLIFLASCSLQTPQNGLTPMPDFADPDDAALHSAMKSYLKNENAPANAQYDFVRLDLNNDNRREALVLMKLPHTYWCDWGGCPLLIFRANRKDFKFISRTENVRGPLFVTKSRSNGWKNFIVRASGTNTHDRNVTLSFNGLIYSKNALGAPTYSAQPNSYTMDKFFR